MDPTTFWSLATHTRPGRSILPDAFASSYGVSVLWHELILRLTRLASPSLSYKTHADWTKRFGQTFRFHGYGKVNMFLHDIIHSLWHIPQHDYRLMTFDFRSIVHILSSSSFEKPWQTRSFLTRLLGRGEWHTIIYFFYALTWSP
jgi:hypothetical protein